MAAQEIQPQEEQEGVQNEIPQGVDSVAQDIKKAKGFLGGLSSKLSKTVSPVLNKGATGAASVGTLIDKSFLKKLIRIFFIIFFLMIVLFIAALLFREVSKNETDGITDGGSTPTPIQYQPFNPSIYAEDPEILKLEEDINVLDRELSGTSLRETSLNPPLLDFNVSF